jgi:hypothetical protein
MGGHPFNIELYLRPEGASPGGPGEFGPDQYLTSVYNFSQPAEQNGETVCSNCSELEEKDVQVTAYIPVTPYLIKMIQEKQLENLEKINVDKVLSRIYYRVAMVRDLFVAVNVTCLILTEQSLTDPSRSEKPSPRRSGSRT